MDWSDDHNDLFPAGSSDDDSDDDSEAELPKEAQEHLTIIKAEPSLCSGAVIPDWLSLVKDDVAQLAQVIQKRHPDVKGDIRAFCQQSTPAKPLLNEMVALCVTNIARRLRLEGENRVRTTRCKSLDRDDLNLIFICQIMPGKQVCLLGFIATVPEGNGAHTVLELQLMYTVQRINLGSRLLQIAEKIASHMGCETVTLIVDPRNKPATGCYTKKQ